MKAKAIIDNLHASIKVAKCGTNKFAWFFSCYWCTVNKDKKDQDADFTKNVLIYVSLTIRPVNKIPVTL